MKKVFSTAQTIKNYFATARLNIIVYGLIQFFFFNIKKKKIFIVLFYSNITKYKYYILQNL